MYFNIALLLYLFTLICSSKNGLTPGEAAIKCNEYFRYVSGIGFGGVFHGARQLGLLNVALHNTMNSMESKYNTFKNRVYTPPKHSNQAAAIVGACYTVKYYAIDNTLASNSLALGYSTTVQTALHNDLERFIDDLKDQIQDGTTHITNGFKFGVAVANDTIMLQDGDGWNAIVAPLTGVYPYEPGKWFAPSIVDGHTLVSGGTIYPQYAYMSTMGLPDSTTVYVPPRPDINTPEFLASYYDVYYNGNRSNPYNIRTPSETANAALIGSNSVWALMNYLAELVIRNNEDALDDNDIIYIYAQQGLNQADAIVHNYYWKRIYNYDGPSQLIYFGGSGYTPDPSWLWNIGVFPSPEYPAGHPEQICAGAEAVRLALYTVGLLSSPTDDVIPGGTVSLCIGNTANFTVTTLPACTEYLTVRKFSQIKDKGIRGRVCGGMHYAVSGYQSKLAGDAIAAYNVANHMTPK